jgi:serine/threonine-protein kinase RsbW
MVSSITPFAFPAGPEPDFGAGDYRRLAVRTVVEVRSLTEQLAADLAHAGFRDKEVFGLRLAVEEAVVNGIKHGNGGDPGKQVRVQYRVTPEQALLMIEDEGPGFHPGELPDPCGEEFLDRPCGRGVFLMRFYTTWVRFNERGNGVLMCKKKS